MPCLALVLELHHPLPDAGAAVGPDWAPAAVATYWPILRALHRFAEDPGGSSMTLAVSPSWMALADDPTAQARVRVELEARLKDGAVDPSLHRFAATTCEGDALRLLRRWNASGAVDVIPTTASHTWLPSVAHDPVVARAQIGLAADDCARRLEARPTGIWLPFLGYAPGLESAMGESGLRFFGVAADVFLRGTVLPPGRTSGPLVTPPGVAAFGVEPSPASQAS